MASVKLVHATPDAEVMVAYLARVSSPNQDNPEYVGLLRYLIRNAHWSPFEMVSMCLEIQTSRAIAAQILRHRSFSFQEFSQRYSVVDAEGEMYRPRRQAEKNRQDSIDNMEPKDVEWFYGLQESVWRHAYGAYEAALKYGIAKEQARFLLPMSTKTKLYMHGTMRSWIHYIQLRTTPGTQKEHRDIAEHAKLHFIKQMPQTAVALGWVKEDVVG